MENLDHKIDLLNQIRQYEGEGFTYDEQAIRRAYQDESENETSLAIKILSIFGGIMATLAFVAALFIANVFSSGWGLITFGVASIIAAVVLNEIYNKLIIDTFSVTLYITGFALFCIGLWDLRVEDSMVAIFTAIIALCALMATQNYIISFISTMIVGGSLFALILTNEIFDFIHVYNGVFAILLTFVFLNEAKLISFNKRLSKLYNPVRIGLVFCLLMGLISIGKRHLIPLESNQIAFSSIGLGLVLVYLVYKITVILALKSAKSQILIYGLTGLILIPTIFAPAILGAIIILLLSFLVNYKTGLAIGVIALVYFVSQYYYDLNFTLLTKSMILISSGIVFLLFYWFTSKNFVADEKV